MSLVSHLPHGAAEHSAACCSRCFSPLPDTGYLNFRRPFSVLISIFSSITLRGALSYLLHSHVYTHECLSAPPACSLISVWEMLPYQHYLHSPAFFLFNKELDFCACSVSASFPSVPALFSCLFSRMSLPFWQSLPVWFLPGLWSSVLPSCFDASGCTEVLTGAFQKHLQQLSAEAWWLFLWQNGMDLQGSNNLANPSSITLCIRLWVNSESPTSHLEWERALSITGYTTLARGSAAAHLALAGAVAGIRHRLLGTKQEPPPVPCPCWCLCWRRFAINLYLFTSQAAGAKPRGYWNVAFRCVIVFLCL